MTSLLVKHVLGVTPLGGSVCVLPAGLWVVMASVSVSSGLNKTLRQHYLSLPQRGLCQVTYVWVDGSGEGLRNKTRTLDREPQGLEGNHSVCSPVWTGFTVVKMPVLKAFTIFWLVEMAQAQL